MQKIYQFSFAMILSLFSVFTQPSISQAAELLMIEQDACPWCERWHKEVGDAYPITQEGKNAPLIKINIHKPIPEAYQGLKLGRFTPTFVVWHKGQEIGRIRGYISEDFFWPMLNEILAKIPADIK